MKILLIKMSSMGDLIHTLPALSDLRKRFANLQVDWVVEESFLDIPRWHPIVNSIIPIANRRWKKNTWQAIKTGELSGFYKKLRADKYDYIIDAQSNLKSALVTRLARGKRCGVDQASVHERGADYAYQIKVNVNRQQHALVRMRELFAKIFEYPIPETEPDFRIDLTSLPSLSFDLPKPFIFINHHASRDYKLWPEVYFNQTIAELLKKGFGIVLPWGSQQERQRAERYASVNPERILVLPDLNLSEKAAVISQATGAISSDTGLGHLAAALNIPNVSFYGPTDPALVGALGKDQVHLKADFACSPCLRSSCHYEGDAPLFPACLATIKPDTVLSELEKLLSTNTKKTHEYAI